MFTELMPILKNRSITITITLEGEGQLRVNVIPKAIAGDASLLRDVTVEDGITEAEAQTLTQPFSLVGTPEELDAELPSLLSIYSNGHVTFAENIKEAQFLLAEVAKAVKSAATAAAKAKSKIVKPADKSAGKTAEKAAAKAAVPAAKISVGGTVLVDETPKLWDVPEGQPTSEIVDEVFDIPEEG